MPQFQFRLPLASIIPLRTNSLPAMPGKSSEGCHGDHGHGTRVAAQSICNRGFRELRLSDNRACDVVVWRPFGHSADQTAHIPAIAK